LLDDDEVLRNPLDRRQYLAGILPHQVDGFVKIAVCVRIDGRDALAAHLHRQMHWPRLGAGRVQHAATAKRDPARGGTLQEISTGGHCSPPFGKSSVSCVTGRLT
jgi:hypothetical protein